MNIVEFSWMPALIGGALIGSSAVILMATLGRIAGISGILGRVLTLTSASPWQWAFVVGLLLSGVLAHWVGGGIELKIETGTPLLILAGLLVGFGTRLGSGCTSGHGVCGLSRISPRSIAATLTFITSGVVTVFVMNLV